MGEEKMSSHERKSPEPGGVEREPGPVIVVTSMGLCVSLNMCGRAYVDVPLGLSEWTVHVARVCRCEDMGTSAPTISSVQPQRAGECCVALALCASPVRRIQAGPLVCARRASAQLWWPLCVAQMHLLIAMSANCSALSAVSSDAFASSAGGRAVSEQGVV
jgi:hypothetical protein